MLKFLAPILNYHFKIPVRMVASFGSDCCASCTPSSPPASDGTRHRRRRQSRPRPDRRLALAHRRPSSRRPGRAPRGIETHQRDLGAHPGQPRPVAGPTRLNAAGPHPHDSYAGTSDGPGHRPNPLTKTPYVDERAFSLPSRLIVIQPDRPLAAAARSAGRGRC
jgi:hypothetical protein